MIPEDTVLDFAAGLFRSVWALDLLLMLRRTQGRRWHDAEIIKELRSSRVVLAEALNNLMSVGLVIAEDDGTYCYRSGNADIEETISELEKIYAVKPTAVMRKIVTTPNAKLQILSDAFRIRE
jgi:hypothetical protein